jgi:hypothetical protein
MTTLILAIFITLTTLLIDLRTKSIQPAYRYIVVFFLVAGVGYFFDGMKELKADEIQPYSRYLRSKEDVVIIHTKNETQTKTKKQLDKELIEKCWEKANYHFDEGCRYLKEAEELSMLFPDIPDFDKSKLCLANVIGALNSGTPAGKLYNLILAVVGQYAFAFTDKWIEFKNLLLHSKSNFEMEEHYRMIGQYHYELYFIEKEEFEKKKK